MSAQQEYDNVDLFVLLNQVGLPLLREIIKYKINRIKLNNFILDLSQLNSPKELIGCVNFNQFINHDQIQVIINANERYYTRDRKNIFKKPSKVTLDQLDITHANSIIVFLIYKDQPQDDFSKLSSDLARIKNNFVSHLTEFKDIYLNIEKRIIYIAGLIDQENEFIKRIKNAKEDPRYKSEQFFKQFQKNVTDWMRIAPWYHKLDNIDKETVEQTIKNFETQSFSEKTEISSSFQYLIKELGEFINETVDQNRRLIQEQNKIIPRNYFLFLKKRRGFFDKFYKGEKYFFYQWILRPL